MIFVLWAYQNAPAYARSILDNPDVLFTVVFILIVAIFFFLLVSLAHQRWLKDGRVTLRGQAETGSAEG